MVGISELAVRSVGISGTKQILEARTLVVVHILGLQVVVAVHKQELKYAKRYNSISAIHF